MSYKIENTDQIVDIVKNDVLSNYSIEQVPEESIVDLTSYLQELFENGDIVTYDDLISKVDEAVSTGLTHGIFYNIK